MIGSQKHKEKQKKKQRKRYNQEGIKQAQRPSYSSEGTQGPLPNISEVVWWECCSNCHTHTKGRKIDKHSVIRIDKRTDRHAARQTGTHTEAQKGSQADSQRDRGTDRMTVSHRVTVMRAALECGNEITDYAKSSSILDCK